MAARAERISIRGLARRLRVTHKAVQNGIASGRLRRSIGWEKGKPVVKNAALAAQEWVAGASKPKANGKAAGDGAAAGPSLNEAQREVALGRAEAIRLANSQRAGRLIDGEAARRDAFECARTVRDALLNIPDRISAELAAEHDAAQVRARLDEELRNALESLARVLSDG